MEGCAMADSKPDWIELYVWERFVKMKTALEEEPDEVESSSYFEGFWNHCAEWEKLLTDPNLKPTWQHLNAALALILPHKREEASASVIGVIILPLKLYAATGTAARPTPKLIIRKNRDKAKAHLQDASHYLRRAANELRAAVDISKYLPDEASTLAEMVRRIFETHDHDRFGKFSSSHFWLSTREFKTNLFLEELATRLTADETPWASVPGMQSSKSSWRDWLREVSANLELANQMYSVNFNLREADWVRLANSLIDPSISRSSINAALRSLSD